MSKKIKNYLGIAIIFSVVLFALSAAAYVKIFYHSISPSSLRTFSVSAQGEAVAVPDIALFSFSVLTQGGLDISAVQEENASKMNKAIEFLKSNGVESKDIQTQAYEVMPRYSDDDCGRYPYLSKCQTQEIIGYTITQTAIVKVRDFSKTGAMLGGVVKNGANNVSSLSFEVDDIEDFRSEARDKAVKAAEEKAKAIAKSAGFRVGRLVSINESFYSPSAGIRYKTMEAAADSIPNIEAGSEEISVTVNIQYEIR